MSVNKLSKEVEYLLDAYNNTSISKEDYIKRIKILNKSGAVSDRAVEILEQIINSEDTEDEYVEQGGCGFIRDKAIKTLNKSNISTGSCFYSNGGC